METGATVCWLGLLPVPFNKWTSLWSAATSGTQAPFHFVQESTMKVLLGWRRTQRNELQMKVSELLGGIIVWKYWLGIGHAFREAYLFCFTPSFLPLRSCRESPCLPHSMGESRLQSYGAVKDTKFKMPYWRDIKWAPILLVFDESREILNTAKILSNTVKLWLMLMRGLHCKHASFFFLFLFF